ncbi:hypothetical protein TH61_07815 [Rufibacter sp. DG15C]|uniref:hypothetical protein n=1 Tax=Rufibacter sp. DG15C TaxID=1379909 RepID=UPI00078E2911|nr:hypothetical protein [Rufibacter sp. DG15C]AMM51106.1 hypothetical protein TH61_07815 [Rufibacter sp. DG15C]
MELQRINHWLGIYQAIGFSLASIILTTVWVRAGGMAVYLIPIMFLLFTPFLIVSFATVSRSFKQNINLDFFVALGIFCLVLSSWLLIIFYEWGGFLIEIICTAIGGIVWYLKNTDTKLLFAQIIGSILLSTIFYYLLWNCLYNQSSF